MIRTLLENARESLGMTPDQYILLAERVNALEKTYLRLTEQLLQASCADDEGLSPDTTETLQRSRRTRIASYCTMLRLDAADVRDAAKLET